MTIDSATAPPDLPCIEFVELVTDYLEGTLPPSRRVQVEHHLEICSGCRTVLAQWRVVIELNGQLDRLEVDRLAPDVRDALVAAFCRVHPAER